jgi:hypothetical protein
MTFFSGKITGYQIALYSSEDTSENVGTRQIDLTATQTVVGDPTAPSTLVMVLVFVPSGQPIPKPEVAPSSTVIICNLYTLLDEYWATLDLLRNASDISLQIDSTNPNGWALTMTAAQNIGQGQVTGPTATPAPAILPLKITLPPNFPGRVPLSLRPK